MKDIILFGIRGSGKGTLAQKIISQFPDTFHIFDPGSMLRALKATENSLTTYIKNTYDKGLLFEDAFIISLFDTYFVTLPSDKYMILDGFPRQLGQMYMMLDRLKRARREYITILLDLSREECIQRQLARRICKNCSSIHSTILHGEIKFCTKCGGDLIIRIEDTPDLINKRLEAYYKQVIPVINYFQDKGDIHQIDATIGIDNIFNEFKKIIN